MHYYAFVFCFARKTLYEQHQIWIKLSAWFAGWIWFTLRRQHFLRTWQQLPNIRTHNFATIKRWTMLSQKCVRIAKRHNRFHKFIPSLILMCTNNYYLLTCVRIMMMMRYIVKTKCELDIVDAKLSMMDYLVSLSAMAQRWKPYILINWYKLNGCETKVETRKSSKLLMLSRIKVWLIRDISIVLVKLTRE